MSPPAGRDGAKAWTCFRNSAARIFDALLALQFSVEGSHEDGFAQQLEPALGKLAVDIRIRLPSRGRVHSQVAASHIPPPGMNLEQDIART